VCLSAGQTSDVDDDKWEIMGLCMLLISSKEKRKNKLFVQNISKNNEAEETIHLSKCTLKVRKGKNGMYCFSI
jgi:hypothetical protein